MGQKTILPGMPTEAEIVAAVAKDFGIPPQEQLVLQHRAILGEADDLHVVILRKMMIAELRFTQSNVSSNFRDGRPIFELMNDLNSGDVDPLWDLEPLDVVWFNGFWRSLSNRRLCMLKAHMATARQNVWVQVRALPVSQEFHDKNKTCNDGLSVQILRSRSPSLASKRGAQSRSPSRSPRAA